ncbi:unnamed protein product [Brassica napus]|uniref:(rape) hypothetical protein n=1 Tax=Brassica napus TaxID=3708 RepID=A0A816K2E0_BRANA|nr:unnamed protein product [Brassica napus]
MRIQWIKYIERNKCGSSISDGTNADQTVQTIELKELDFNGINASVEISVINRASAIDVKETVNDDMCVLISSLITNAYTLVICAGVQENGKLPTENEPKIGLSLQNVRTVKVCLSLFPNIYLWCSYNVQWLSSSQFLSRYIVHVLILSPHKDNWSVLTGKNVLLFLSAQWQ